MARWVQQWSEDRGWHLVEREPSVRPVAPAIYGDLPAYISPVTGKLVEGRKARQRDLAESGCRPFERGEREEARKRVRERDRKLEQTIVERLRWVGA